MLVRSELLSSTRRYISLTITLAEACFTQVVPTVSDRHHFPYLAHRQYSIARAHLLFTVVRLIAWRSAPLWFLLVWRSLTLMSKYTLTVNGQSRSVDVASDTPLLWVLRDNLELVGTKFGCGVGQCGACTVHLNGVPTRSCLTPISTVGRKQVTTIEGLDATASHPLQKAWCELDVPQCGYCQAGQIMTAAALLKENPKPSDQDIDDSMAGNLCRCATYLRIRAGIRRASEIAAAGGSATGSGGNGGTR